jgi:hypothetical protein
MRTVLLLSLLFFAAFSQAQSIPFNQMNYARPGTVNQFSDSTHKKWFVSTATGFSTSIHFFKGGHASVLSVPLILQLNRRLSNNWYAFAAVSAAPSYIHFGNSFISNNAGKGWQQNGFMKSGTMGIYSKAELGLMYVNEAKTFSISGSIGIERSSYPGVPYYPLNNSYPAAVRPSNR